MTDVAGLYDGDVTSPGEAVQPAEASRLHDLLSHAYALSEIRYGLDDEPLDTTVPFTPRETMGTILNTDVTYVEIRPQVRSATIVVTFLDGTTMKRRVLVAP